MQSFHQTAEIPLEGTDILKAYMTHTWWQCMFAHTHRRSLSLLLPWTILQAATIFPSPSAPSTLKDPYMCHLQEHSQKPWAVTFLKISPVNSVSLLWKPMEINTLSINIVYSSKYLLRVYLNLKKLYQDTEHLDQRLVGNPSTRQLPWKSAVANEQNEETNLYHKKIYSQKMSGHIAIYQYINWSQIYFCFNFVSPYGPVLAHRDQTDADSCKYFIMH